MRRKSTAALIASALIVLASALPAAAATPDRENERGTVSYFIDARGESDHTRSSAVVRGHTIVSGYVFSDRDRCLYEDGINLIDFAKTKVRDGRFHDVDQIPNVYRDSVRGERAPGRIKGSALGLTKLEGEDCRFRTRFTLKPVDRGTWQRYTKKARKYDRKIGHGTDNRVLRVPPLEGTVDSWCAGNYSTCTAIDKRRGKHVLVLISPQSTSLASGGKA